MPAVAALAMLAACGWTGSAASAAAASAEQSINVAAAPVRVAQTPNGPVGYRVVGSGSPLLLITGFSAGMDDWSPAFVDALASHHRVVVFDNAGVGMTGALDPLTITAMANQTSALITSLRLGRPSVLGWSMGGMVAQALAVLHPSQVSHLVLAATQAGNGKALPIPSAAAAAAASTNAAMVLGVLFPPSQATAVKTYVHGILEYANYYSAPAATKTAQTAAIQQWLAGDDQAGHLTTDIRVPTLVADGTVDALDPVANDHLLARTIPGAQLALYSDAGHGFLFQDLASFVSRVDQFIR